MLLERTQDPEKDQARHGRGLPGGCPWSPRDGFGGSADQTPSQLEGDGIVKHMTT